MVHTQCAHFEFGHDPIESLAGELASAQCSTQVGPIEELCACCCQQRCDARFYQHLLHVLSPSAVYVAEDSRHLGVVVRPGAHSDFQYDVVSEPMARESIEALFAYVIPLNVGDDPLRRDLFPMLDHPSMKIAEIPEVPIEAAARDAELARKHIHLQSTDALVGERGQSEINPVLGRQPFGHEPPIQ